MCPLKDGNYMNISFSRPFLGDEETRMVADVIQSGWLVSGPMVQRFEEEIAEYCGVEEAVCVSSWTTGAFLLLLELGIGTGDDVIVPSSTFIASVNVIRHVGANPIFIDIDPDDWNLNISLIESLITSNTKAIIAVEQLGQPYRSEKLKEICEKNELFLINDAACSIGAKLGNNPSTSLFDFSIISFHARKIVTTGEGGAILLKDATLARKLRQMRHQGMSINDLIRHADPTVSEEYPVVGYNFRMTDIQAAIGVAQLKKIEEIIEKRKLIARYYDEKLHDYKSITLRNIPDNITPNYQTYQILLNLYNKCDREALIYKMWLEGIPIKRGVMAVHQQVAYKSRNDIHNILPETEKVASQGIQLPLHPQMTIEEADFVIEKLFKFIDI